MSRTLLVETSEHVCQLTLNRPERLNAVDTDLLDTMADAVYDALRNDAVHVIRMRGSKRAFSAGADLKSGEPSANKGNWVQKSTAFHKLLIEADKPIITSVQGYALGLGMSIAACADILVVGPETVMGLPEVEHALMSGIASASLSRRMPIISVTDLAISGRKVTLADGLERINMADRIARTSDRVEELADETARKIATFDPGLLKKTKEMTRSFEHVPLDVRLTLGSSAIVSHLATRTERA